MCSRMSDIDWRRLHGRVMPNPLAISAFKELLLSGKLHEQYLAKDLHKIIKEMREILHEHGELREAANFPLSGKKSDLARAAAAAAHVLNLSGQQQQQRHCHLSASSLTTPTLSLTTARTSRTPVHRLHSHADFDDHHHHQHNVYSNNDSSDQYPMQGPNKARSPRSAAAAVTSTGRNGDCNVNNEHDSGSNKDRSTNAHGSSATAVCLRGPPHLLKIPALQFSMAGVSVTDGLVVPERGSAWVDSPTLLPSPSVRLSSAVELDSDTSTTHAATMARTSTEKTMPDHYDDRNTTHNNNNNNNSDSNNCSKNDFANRDYSTQECGDKDSRAAVTPSRQAAVSSPPSRTRHARTPPITDHIHEDEDDADGAVRRQRRGSPEGVYSGIEANSSTCHSSSMSSPNNTRNDHDIKSNTNSRESSSLNGHALHSPQQEQQNVSTSNRCVTSVHPPVPYHDNIASHSSSLLCAASAAVATAVMPVGTSRALSAMRVGSSSSSSSRNHELTLLNTRALPFYQILNVVRRVHMRYGAHPVKFDIPVQYAAAVHSRRLRVQLIPMRHPAIPTRWPTAREIVVYVNDQRVCTPWRRAWPERQPEVAKSFLPLDLTQLLHRHSTTQTVYMDIFHKEYLSIGMVAVTQSFSLAQVVQSVLERALGEARLPAIVSQLLFSCSPCSALANPHRSGCVATPSPSLLCSPQLAENDIRVLQFYRSVTQAESSGPGGNDDDGLEADDPVVSTRCPISRMVMDIPIRGAQCRHLQCVDLSSYLVSGSKGCYWNCALCDRELRYDALVIDTVLWRRMLCGRDGRIAVTATAAAAAYGAPRGADSKDTEPHTEEQQGGNAGVTEGQHSGKGGDRSESGPVSPSVTRAAAATGSREQSDAMASAAGYYTADAPAYLRLSHTHTHIDAGRTSDSTGSRGSISGDVCGKSGDGSPSRHASFSRSCCTHGSGGSPGACCEGPCGLHGIYDEKRKSTVYFTWYPSRPGGGGQDIVIDSSDSDNSESQSDGNRKETEDGIAARAATSVMNPCSESYNSSSHGRSSNSDPCRREEDELRYASQNILSCGQGQSVPHAMDGSTTRSEFAGNPSAAAWSVHPMSVASGECEGGDDAMTHKRLREDEGVVQCGTADAPIEL